VWYAFPPRLPIWCYVRGLNASSDNWVVSCVYMTQIRWAARSRSRSKERRVCRKDNQETQGQDGVDQQALQQGEPRLRRDSTTDYAADNSSEHSSTATPLTQSPRHRLLNIQHGNGKLWSFVWVGRLETKDVLTICIVQCSGVVSELCYVQRRWPWITLRLGAVTLNYATFKGDDSELHTFRGW